MHKTLVWNHVNLKRDYEEVDTKKSEYNKTMNAE